MVDWMVCAPGAAEKPNPHLRAMVFKAMEAGCRFFSRNGTEYAYYAACPEGVFLRAVDGAVEAVLSSDDDPHSPTHGRMRWQTKDGTRPVLFTWASFGRDVFIVEGAASSLDVPCVVWKEPVPGLPPKPAKFEPPRPKGHKSHRP